MKYRFLLILILLFSKNYLFAQTKSTTFKNWSKWIPVIDRNENKVQVSISFEPHPVVVQQTGKTVVYFNYKLLNRYNEPISGRLQYNYIRTDGTETQMNCPIYCLQPDEEYFNFHHSLSGIAKVIDFKFVEFSPCSEKSKLLSYTAKDTLLFSIYNEIKKEEGQKQNLLASSNENDKKNILIDNSDGVILYMGVNESHIKTLLSNVKGWRTNSGLQIQDGIPPQVIFNGDCQRDVYVNSAVLYSWAAESYYRIKEVEKAKVAASKVGELLQFVQQLCSNGGLSFQTGACKTEAMFPCSDANSMNLLSNTSGNSVQPQSAKSAVQNSNVTNSNNKSADFDKEKELFSGLLPIISAFGANSYEAQATSISSFADKLATYTENDSMSSGFLKVMTKLAALNVKMQANEITNNYNSSLSSNIKGSTISTTSLGLSTNTTTGFSQMNSFQQRAYIESVVMELAKLFERKENANGLTDEEQNRRDKLEQIIKIRNREYREKYGYTVKQFTEAIRNFDDLLLDKILVSGFPVDTKVMDDIDEDGSSIYAGKDYWLPGLHYAAKVGNDYAVKKFIDLGVDVNLKATSYYKTYCRPIDLAVYYDRYTTVKLLIERGVSLNEKLSWPMYAKSLLSEAKELNYYDITKLLERYSNKK